MKKKPLRGSRVYWVATLDNYECEKAVFNTRKEAAHFIDHRVEGWADRNGNHGWSLYQCHAFGMWRP